MFEWAATEASFGVHTALPSSATSGRKVSSQSLVQWIVSLAEPTLLHPDLASFSVGADLDRQDHKKQCMRVHYRIWLVLNQG